MFSGTAKKRKNSFILTALLLGLICYLVFTWLGLQGKIQDQQQQIAIVNEKIDEQNYENNKLKKILNAGEESDYIEHIARRDLNYVMPGERVYYDISAGEN